MRLVVLLSLVLLAALSTGCAGHKKPKTESHIYGGDAPSIKFTERQERAGGELKTY